MPGPTTSNITSGTQYLTLDEMLAGVERAFRTPRPIGTLHGETVWLNQWDRTLTIDGVAVSVPVDHPYLIGTKIRTAALAMMGEPDSTGIVTDDRTALPQRTEHE